MNIRIRYGHKKMNPTRYVITVEKKPFTWSRPFAPRWYVNVECQVSSLTNGDYYFKSQAERQKKEMQGVMQSIRRVECDAVLKEAA